MGKALKTLIIGLDGATFDVLLPLIDKGHLPHLASLMEKGAWGRLNSTIPPFTGAAWSTFATGQNPGEHGIISFQERDPFSYDSTGSGIVDARRLKFTLWEIIGKHGKRVAIINVPMTYPPRAVNGYMVTGMLTPHGADEFTYPSSLSRSLSEDYIVDLDFIRKDGQFRTRDFPSKSEILASIRQMSSARGGFCLKLIQEQHWDFFMVVFTGTDRLSHFLWDELEFMRSAAERSYSQLHTDILAYLNELDQMVGELIQAAGDKAISLVLSDHGFGSSPGKRVYINIWLEQLGLIQRRDRSGLVDPEYWRVKIGKMDRIRGLIRRLLPEHAQNDISDVASSHSPGIIDWSQTKAYWVPLYFQFCGIEINLVGRNSEGVVSQGEEYEALRTLIIEEAKKIIDRDTNTPIVEEALRREDLYTGRNVDRFPDVIMVLKPDYFSGGSLAGNDLVVDANPTRPGEHRQDGIFTAAGPNIAKVTDLAGANLVDVPPTILYAMGLPVPDSFDGRVMTEIFNPKHIEETPVEYSDSIPEDDTMASRESRLSAEEEDLLRQRLKGLGYIE